MQFSESIQPRKNNNIANSMWRNNKLWLRKEIKYLLHNFFLLLKSSQIVFFILQDALNVAIWIRWRNTFCFMQYRVRNAYVCVLAPTNPLSNEETLENQYFFGT